MKIVPIVNAFQIRERGIMSQGRFIRWDEIQSLKWIGVKNQDRLQVTLKNTPRPLMVFIPGAQQYSAGEILRQRFPELRLNSLTSAH